MDGFLARPLELLGDFDAAGGANVRLDRFDDLTGWKKHRTFAYTTSNDSCAKEKTASFSRS
jgi:hypothetical protein